METRPTLDPDFKVKPTRPTWRSAIGFLAFLALFVTVAATAPM